jgi:hypothetical protein
MGLAEAAEPPTIAAAIRTAANIFILAVSISNSR